MSWLPRLAVCGFAVLFAASGVRKVTDPEAGAWQVAHGGARVAFGSAVVVGTVWSTVRRRNAGPEPSAPADPGTPPCTGPDLGSGSS
ncbi:hypothetical protein [Urbifossiella limnaea]|uniref:Uncharacterized protein n=1 Tax=Urbifossiella limnaea TaxID=2528023 RepID=A0A517XMG5_9BACT|nr:hypothetical protein [Urbifossiella limnaea]QDU18700.1 hypothetical protein ETAA1_05930 [Urbifossiella limnaea]